MAIMEDGSFCYTIGYGNRSLEYLIDMVQSFNISYLVDIRSYPHSVHEEFNKENLEIVLPKNNIVYSHCPGLGGLRDGSYMDYTKTDEFRKYYSRLVNKIEAVNKAGSGIVLMCAEKNPKDCHRYHLSKVLESCGIKVIHLTDPGQVDLFMF